MENNKFPPRCQVAVGLLIAEAFQECLDVNEVDKKLALQGISLAWDWLAGHQVHPYEICAYVDGEINLPARSTEYERGSEARDFMISSFHSIGMAAYHACAEKEIMPTEGVENFGNNEWNLLLQRKEKLGQRSQFINHAMKYFSSLVTEDTSSDKCRYLDRNSLLVLISNY